MSRTTATLAFGLSVLACGGHSQSLDSSDASGPGVAKVQGSVGGISFPGSAYAVAIPDNENATATPGNQYTQLALAIAGKPLACDTSGLPNSLFIGIQIIATGSDPIGPGTYSINTDPQGSDDNVAALVTTDARCTESAPASCIGGSVTITSTTSTSISGSFTLAFDSGEAMTGTFAADVCTAIPASVSGKPC